MDLEATDDGGRGKPELTLEQVRDWDTKKQQQILDVLLETDPIDTDAKFDVEVVENRLEDELGDERPSTGYIHHVRGKYTRVVPENSRLSWDPPFVLVQVSLDKGHAPQRRHILSAITEFAEVSDDGVINIDRVGEEVIRKSGRDRQPTSNIWQTIGRFAAVVPEDKMDYQHDLAVAADSGDNEEKQEEGVAEDTQSRFVDTLTPDDEAVDSSSYHMGFADGFRAAMKEQRD